MYCPHLLRRMWIIFTRLFFFRRIRMRREVRLFAGFHVVEAFSDSFLLIVGQGREERQV